MTPGKEVRKGRVGSSVWDITADPPVFTYERVLPGGGGATETVPYVRGRSEARAGC